MFKRRVKKSQESEDILLKVTSDRRLLSNVPDPNKIRSGEDRRGSGIEDIKDEDKLRYRVEYDVNVTCYSKKFNKVNFKCKGVNVSTTGILLKIEDKEQAYILESSNSIVLKFKVTPGSMPEGYENKVKTKAQYIRTNINDGEMFIAVKFNKNLREVNKSTGTYTILISSLLLAFVTLFIIFMRIESVLYFKFNRWMYLYSIITASFLLTRYIWGAFYRPVKVDPDYTPGVSILIPCFNEEQWIQQTIISCINQNYPIDKLEVIVIDDCSNDKSVEKIKEIVDKLVKENERFEVKDRIKYIVQKQNAGKREALAVGAKEAKHDLLVFVDSDSFLAPNAIRNLVQPFKDSKMGGVAGRTDVANTYTNVLTKMQSVRYYIAFRIMKAAEARFDAVTCLSGPLSCYRRDIVIENTDAWLNQSFLGQKATFGDDRAMTNFVLSKYRTGYQDTAVCSTIVPNKYKVFLKQQMRWKRSWLRESLIAGKFMWKKEPFAAVTFYMGLLVPILAPVVVVYNLIIVPFTYNIFPKTFIIGLLMMAMLMSITQLRLRKSTTWFFGLVFCLFYEAVLLWQMPVAWVTFWKSTWGTRMTPSDIEEMNKKEEAKNRKLKKRMTKINVKDNLN